MKKLLGSWSSRDFSWKLTCRKSASEDSRNGMRVLAQRIEEPDQSKRHGFLRASLSSLRTGLNIQVLHVQRVLFNKFAPRLHILAHQGSEDDLAGFNVLGLYG